LKTYDVCCGKTPLFEGPVAARVDWRSTLVRHCVLASHIPAAFANKQPVIVNNNNTTAQSGVWLLFVAMPVSN